MFYRPLPTLSPFLIGHLAYVDVKHQESKILSFCSSCHTHSTARVKQAHEFHIFCSSLFYIRKHRQSTGPKESRPQKSPAAPEEELLHTAKLANTTKL